MWIYIFTAVFVLFALYKERQALGCPDVPNGRDCANADGKAVKNTKPTPDDDNATLYAKIERAAGFCDKWVMWRLALLVAVPCVFLMYFFGAFAGTGGGRTYPTEQELLIGLFVITALVYFTLNFYNFHLMRIARDHIAEAVEILKTRSG